MALFTYMHHSCSPPDHRTYLSSASWGGRNDGKRT